MAIWGLVVLSQYLGLFAGLVHPVEWFGIHSMAFLGLLDDRFNLQARYKAIVGLGIAFSLALFAGASASPSVREVSFLGIGLPNVPLVIVPVLMLWYWAVPQAYNLIDGINGLSVGFGALLLGVLGWNLGHQPMLLWGSLTAFLMLNYPKAKHFLGDCGALMLGTLFAVLGVKAFALRDPNLLLWVYAYPTVDVFLVVSIRRWKGVSLSTADRSHLHHWMVDRLAGKAWLATPLLLILAALPMLRATEIPGHELASSVGLGALLLLAFKAFKDRVLLPAKIEEHAQVRREVPLMQPRVNLDAPSGSHHLL
ncbi:MAG: undecaprenyl/decaprenyl-phosphate alpha-N-acetylglucosaminyl 1-phosphate transferase [Acidobacteria bacterium]|nr:undecaprenyl/decaprenyl-phosphate alpha-N-acetylglucosaminyl 1-phosphate transferase [Acidobacteriota bacterium]MBI3488957.1 undecaprenyl/decaprenyl-phosphate alpha-N-acetylglucosaminyl 1-phosphate transferase [Acidobacteriota bacterium]